MSQQGQVVRAWLPEHASRAGPLRVMVTLHSLNRVSEPGSLSATTRRPRHQESVRGTH